MARRDVTVGVATPFVGGAPNTLFNTVWGDPNASPDDVTLTDVSNNFDYFSGTDSLTGQEFTYSTVGPTAQPRLWGDPWDTRPPSIHKIAGTSGGDWWNNIIARNVNGPGGTNNENVLRTTRLFDSDGVPQCGIEITHKGTAAADMGMLYLRYTRRLKDFVGSIGNNFQTLSAFKCGSASETGDRRLYLSCGWNSTLSSWVIALQTSNSSSSYPGGEVWNVGSPLRYTQALPRAPDMFQDGPSGGERMRYYGVFEDVPGGPGLEPDWSKWATVVFAFRLQSEGPTYNWVAGDADQGWVYVATALGTATAAPANSALKTRMYLAGPSVYDQRLHDGGKQGMLFCHNVYSISNGYPTNVGVELGSVEIYDGWPLDHPAAEIPAGAD